MIDPRAVILDLDGVLVETEPLKALAHSETVAQFGGRVAPRFYAKVMGRPHGDVRDAFLAQGRVAVNGDDYAAAFEARYAELLATRTQLTRGAADLVTRARSRGMKIALATSSRRWMTDQVLAITGCAQAFDCVICAEDVDAHKPAPHCYQAALERLGIGAGAALAVEDSDSGVAAAVAAGIPVIALRHSLNQGHEFPGAARIVESLDEVLAAEEVAA